MDPPEDPGYEPMPDRIKPMLARSGQLPPDEEKWGFEVKWDGIRTVVFCDHGHIELQGRNFTDFTPRYPEVRELARELGARRVILDGEIVAFDEQGRPSFERLQARMHLASDSAVRRRMRDTPVTYVVFDLLYLDGHSTMPLPLRAAARAARGARAGGPRLARRRPTTAARAARCWRPRASSASRASSPSGSTRPTSRAGARPGWVKVKNVCEQDVVIGGWTPGEGGRSSRLGALAVGVHGGRQAASTPARSAPASPRRRWRCCSASSSRCARPDSPFAGRQPPKGTIFVEPRLVARVELREWTRSGTMRAPSFKGLRDDKDPQECVREAGQAPDAQ